MDYAKYIWNYFLSKLNNNEFGVSGLMGNLKAESGLIPYRLQGDFTNGYQTSKNYTAKVDSGEISKYDFMHNAPNGGGYGLAQWTFYTRKENLYNMWKNGNYSSIGCIELACDFLWYELSQGYTSVLEVLKNATSIKEASDYVLHNFERPADQSASVEAVRESLGKSIYNTYSGTAPEGRGSGGSSGTTTNKKKLSKLLLMSTVLDRN